MQNVRDLLAKTFSVECPQKTLPNLNEPQMTDTTGADYWDRYYSPDSAIRKWDEEHGIRLVRNDTGMTSFEINRDIFAAENVTSIFPEYFKDRTLDRFSINFYDVKNRGLAKEALDVTTRYLENYDMIVNEAGGGGLYYYSKTRGSGKTFLSTILGNELTKLGHRVRWFSMAFWLQELRDSFDRESGTSTAQVLDQARNAEILMLDDIGVEKQSAWVNETVYTLLDFRLSTCKPTIFTSNIMPGELNYDERIIDRIYRMTELVNMPEESIRKKMASRSRLTGILRG